MQNYRHHISTTITNRFLPVPESVLKGLEKEPSISDFTIIREIGSGSFGRVLLVKHNKTKIEYAIKLIDKKNKQNINGKPYFRREIEIMYKIHHSNVVRLFCHFEDEEFCYFVMEYVNNGNLYSKITNSKSLTHKEIASIVKDVISAVYYLHNMDPPIIHRDIKPENVLIGEKGEAKLTDFGWSNYVEEKCERNTFCGTPIYLAPEIIKNKGHDERVDIWCIGILLFELVTKRTPFSGKDKSHLMNNITDLKISWPSNMPLDAKDLISKILKEEPNQRPSLSAILHHSFFTKNFPNAPSVLVKPYQIHTDPYVLSRDVPTTTYKIIKRPEKMNSRQFKAIKRDNTPVPNIRIRLDQITNLNSSQDMNNNNNNNANNNNSNNNSNTNHNNNEHKMKLTSHLKNNNKDDKDEYEQLIEEYNNLIKLHKDIVFKLDEAVSTKNKISKSIDILTDKITIQDKINKSLDCKVAALFQSRNELENEMKIKIKLSRTPRRLVNSNTETSIMGDKRNVKKVKNEFQKKKEEYDKDITLMLNEQEELKKTLSQLESNENKMISKINYQIYKIKNLENDIEKYKLHESEIKNKIQDIPRNSNK